MDLALEDRPAYESPGQGVIGSLGRLVRGGPREEADEHERDGPCPGGPCSGLGVFHGARPLY
jgi:hypothetical protein